jgi:hypothetical protein
MDKGICRSGEYLVMKIPKIFLAENRPKAIHKNPCKNCPATKETDPECEDIKNWPKKDRIETVFPCAWRSNKICKGYCDVMGIKQTDLNL